MLSAKELRKKERSRSSAKKQFYVALLDQFSRKINTTSALGAKFCIVTVPTIMIGYPRYELTSTMVYMTRQLARLGYKVSLVGPLDIRVSWETTKKEVYTDDVDPGMLPSLINLSKTAEKLRVIKRN